MIPLLFTAIPGLISLAEKIFVSHPSDASASGAGAVLQKGLDVSALGASKKAFVLGVLEIIYDKGLVKFVHDFPNVDEKRLFLRVCDVMIEELIPALT